MAWVRIDDEFPEHPKLDALGMFAPLAGWLHICALCYCNRKLTDGVVPYARVGMLANFDHIGYEVAGDDMSSIGRDVDPYRLAEALVAVGIWHECEDGFTIHDYLDFQPSKETVDTKCAHIAQVRSRAGKAGAIARWGEKPQVDGGNVANEKQSTSQTNGPKPNTQRDTDIKTSPCLDKQTTKPAPSSAVSYFEEKVGREARGDECISIAKWCKRYGIGRTNEAVGQAALQGEPGNMALIATILKTGGG